MFRPGLLRPLARSLTARLAPRRIQGLRSELIWVLFRALILALILARR